jgi:hypothetical protein
MHSITVLSMTVGSCYMLHATAVSLLSNLSLQIISAG